MNIFQKIFFAEIWVISMFILRNDAVLHNDIIVQWHHNVIKQLLATNRPAFSQFSWKWVGNTVQDTRTTESQMAS